jgi:hypothetical protein
MLGRLHSFESPTAREVLYLACHKRGLRALL